jgi:hypothetical protein
VREGRGEDKTVDKMRFWGLIILFTSIWFIHDFECGTISNNSSRAIQVLTLHYVRHFAIISSFKLPRVGYIMLYVYCNSDLCWTPHAASTFNKQFQRNI